MHKLSTLYWQQPALPSTAHRTQHVAEDDLYFANTVGSIRTR